MKFECKAIKAIARKGLPVITAISFLIPYSTSRSFSEHLEESMYHYTVGRMHELNEEFTEGLRHYETALSLDQDSAYLNNAIGELLTQSNDLQYAIVYFKEAIKIDETLPEARTNLIDAYIRINDLEKAAEEVKRMLEKKPGDIVAIGYLGEVTYHSGNLEEAKRCFEKVTESESAKDELIVAYYRLGKISYQEGKYTKAIEDFENALKVMNPVKPYNTFLGYKAKIGLAQSYYGSGDSIKAGEKLDILYKELKNEPGRTLAEIILQLKEVKDLETILKKEGNLEKK